MGLMSRGITESFKQDAFVGVGAIVGALLGKLGADSIVSSEGMLGGIANFAIAFAGLAAGAAGGYMIGTMGAAPEAGATPAPSPVPGVKPAVAPEASPAVIQALGNTPVRPEGMKLQASHVEHAPVPGHLPPAPVSLKQIG
jgi:uncharacterized membrane protein YebE (DUF533 family)